jgi:hypothetical protein
MTNLILSQECKDALTLENSSIIVQCFNTDILEEKWTKFRFKPNSVVRPSFLTLLKVILNIQLFLFP